MYRAAMPHTRSGHVEQLRSGSWRASVYAGKDPLTGREIRFRKTCTTERDAQIGLGKLLALARAARQPDSDITVAQLLDQYVQTAGWICPPGKATSGASGGPSNQPLGPCKCARSGALC
jgi:hypothetical protein